MEWQPISTAPKDGTDVLLYCCGKYRVGHFQVTWNVWVENQDYTEVAPSNWMPLPTPPNS